MLIPRLRVSRYEQWKTQFEEVPEPITLSEKEEFMKTLTGASPRLTQCTHSPPHLCTTLLTVVCALCVLQACRRT